VRIDGPNRAIVSNGVEILAVLIDNGDAWHLGSAKARFPTRYAVLIDGIS
jgi:hypothetical protein